MLDVHVVLQAGGQGQRLRPATESTPKPLLTVGGVPMIERLLRQAVIGGARSFSIIVGWLGESIVRHLSALEDLPHGLKLNYIREEKPLGNVGSLSAVATEGKSVLLIFGDLVTDLDFAKIVALHRGWNADITLASHYETQRLRLGELFVDQERVLGYQEKPEKRFLICSGIVVIEPRVLRLLTPDRPTGLSDLVTAALDQRYTVMHWTHGAFWMDVNSIEDLQRANQTVYQLNQG